MLATREMSISRPGSPHGTAWFPPQTWAIVLSPKCSGRFFILEMKPYTIRNVIHKSPLEEREETAPSHSCLDGCDDYPGLPVKWRAAELPSELSGFPRPSAITSYATC